jgi:hypothetical protein
VSLPHVSLPDVDLQVVTDRAGDVGAIVTDAWSTSLDRAQDLAAVAKDVIDDIPEKAIALAGVVIPALRPPRSRSRRPLLLLVVALTSVAVVAWFLRRRRSTTTEPFAVPGEVPSHADVSAAS